MAERASGLKRKLAEVELDSDSDDSDSGISILQPPAKRRLIQNNSDSNRSHNNLVVGASATSSSRSTTPTAISVTKVKHKSKSKSKTKYRRNESRILTTQQSSQYTNYLKWRELQPYLYDNVITYALKHTCRSIQWVPHSNHSSGDYYQSYNLVIGSTTNTFDDVADSPSATTKPLDSSFSSSSSCGGGGNGGGGGSGASSPAPSRKLVESHYLQNIHAYLPNRRQPQPHRQRQPRPDSNVRLRNDSVMMAGASVRSLCDIYRIRVMPQQPHIIATRSDHEDVALYWLNFNHSHYDPSDLKPRGSGDTRIDDALYPTRHHNTHPTSEISDMDDGSPHFADDPNHNHNPHPPPSTKRAPIGSKTIDFNEDFGRLIGVCTEHPNKPTLKYRKKGWGLAWNEVKPGLLIAGNNDGTIVEWNLQQYVPTNRPNNAGAPLIKDREWKDYYPESVYSDQQTKAISNQNDESRSITYVEWCPNSADLFATTSASSHMCIWDRRRTPKEPVRRVIAGTHSTESLCVSWNRGKLHMLASGGRDGELKIWDIRKLHGPIKRFHQCRKSTSIYHVKWCPYNSDMVGASSDSGLLFLYDLRRTPQRTNRCDGSGDDSGTTKPSAQPSSRVPSEMFFCHAGHSTAIPEFDFCPSQDLTIASTEMNGVVQIWKPFNALLDPIRSLHHCRTRFNQPTSISTDETLIPPQNPAKSSLIDRLPLQSRIAPMDDRTVISNGSDGKSQSQTTVMTSSNTVTPATTPVVAQQPHYRHRQRHRHGSNSSDLSLSAKSTPKHMFGDPYWHLEGRATDASPRDFLSPPNTDSTVGHKSGHSTHATPSYPTTPNGAQHHPSLMATNISNLTTPVFKTPNNHNVV